MLFRITIIFVIALYSISSIGYTEGWGVRGGPRVRAKIKPVVLPRKAPFPANTPRWARLGVGIYKAKNGVLVSVGSSISKANLAISMAKSLLSSFITHKMSYILANLRENKEFNKYLRIAIDISARNVGVFNARYKGVDVVWVKVKLNVKQVILNALKIMLAKKCTPELVDLALKIAVEANHIAKQITTPLKIDKKISAKIRNFSVHFLGRFKATLKSDFNKWHGVLVPVVRLNVNVK